MLRICLSCLPLKTELQMGIEPQKTFYTTDGSWIDWNPIALEKTPNTPFGKAEKNAPKGGWPKSTTQRISRKQKKVPKGGIREMRAITTQEEIARFATKWSHKKSYQGIDQIMLNLLPLDKQNKPKTDCNVPDWGHFLQKEARGTQKQ